MVNKDFEEIYYTCKPPKTYRDIDGYKALDYRGDDVRGNAHAVKSSNTDPLTKYMAIRNIALHIINQNILSERDTIVPAPQHTGKAEYTLQIAKMVSEHTGCRIADILECVPRETLYDLKKKKGSNRDIEIETGLYLSGEIPQNTTLWFLDNIIASGRTYLDAKKLIPKLKPLPYAVSTRATIEKTNEDDFNIIYGQK